MDWAWGYGIREVPILARVVSVCWVGSQRKMTDHKQDQLMNRTADRRYMCPPIFDYHLRQNVEPMPPMGFEPKISACERPHTHALDRAATGTGIQPSNVTYLLYNRPVCRTLSNRLRLKTHFKPSTVHLPLLNKP